MIVVAFLLLLALALVRRKRCVMQPNAFDLGFRKWAFGVTYDIPIPSLTAMMAWNAFHADKLRLREDGIFAHDIGLMWELYLKWVEEKMKQGQDEDFLQQIKRAGSYRPDRTIEELDQQKPLTGQSNEGQ